MQKTKSPIIIINWKSNVDDINQIKNLLKEIEKEYIFLLKKRSKETKKKFIKRDLSFCLSLPPVFIYPIQNFVKENKNFKKIIIGAQDFDEIMENNENNKVLLKQIISVGAKFVILGDEYIKNKLEKLEEYKENIKKIENINNNDKIEPKTNNSLIQRLESFTNSKNKLENKNNLINKAEDLEKTEKRIIFKKIYEKEIYKIKEKVKSSLENKIDTVLIIKDGDNDTNILIDLIKEIIKDIHYNLFDKFTICYETEKSFKETENKYIENCQEKVIIIRRTVANMFGIDNAKKINIIYGDRVNETNIKEILKNGGVDGVLLTENSTDSKFLANIFLNINQ